MFCTVLLTMRTYALHNRSKRIMWFMIICAAILFSVACVGHVLDSMYRVLRERFQWFTFQGKDSDARDTLSIRCYNAVPANVYVHLAGYFSCQLKQCGFSEEFVRVDVLSSFE